MKIALVVYSLNVGGMETALLQLAGALRVRGCQVTFVVTEMIGSWHELPRRRGFEVCEVLPIPYHSRIRHAHRIADVLSNYDVCLLNNARFAQSALGLIPPSTCTIAILHNLHETIFRIGLANAENLDAAVAVGEAVRQQAIRLVGNALAVRYIPNGIDLGQVNSHKSRDPNTPLRIIYLGRIEHEQKGVLYLPQIIAGLLDQGLSFSLDVVGDGPDMPILSAALTDLLTSSSLRLHGSLNPEGAMRVLEGADVLLLPSHYEGQGLVLVEAMARGVVPVASRLPGITDQVIEDKRSGLLVGVAQVSEFVAAIGNLCSDADLLNKLSVGALSRARDNFDSKLMAERYLALIEELRARPNLRSGRLAEDLLGRAAKLPEVIRRVADYLLNGARKRT